MVALTREFIRNPEHNMATTNLSSTAGVSPTTLSGPAPSPETIVDATIEEYRSDPIDVLNLSDAEGELKYLRMLQSSYERTVRDLASHFAAMPKKEEIHLFEIGAYLGVVSVSLRKLGFKVTATDFAAVPETVRGATVPTVGHGSVHSSPTRPPSNQRTKRRNTRFSLLVSCNAST